MLLKAQAATVPDAATLAGLHTAVAERLTARYGPGPWSAKTSERGVLFAMRQSRVFVVRAGAETVATFRLATRKPWAIDTSYFTACERPLYLLGLAVWPEQQRQGIGTWCMEAIRKLAKAWPADAIRLDAYAAPVGAGGFYPRCGFTEQGRVTYRNAPLIYYESVIATPSTAGRAPDVNFKKAKAESNAVQKELI